MRNGETLPFLARGCSILYYINHRHRTSNMCNAVRLKKGPRLALYCSKLMTLIASQSFAGKTREYIRIDKVSTVQAARDIWKLTIVWAVSLGNRPARTFSFCSTSETATNTDSGYNSCKTISTKCDWPTSRAPSQHRPIMMERKRNNKWWIMKQSSVIYQGRRICPTANRNTHEFCGRMSTSCPFFICRLLHC